MGNEDVTGDEVYQPDAAEIREDDGILDPEDTLGDQESDPYDEGWAPPERPLGATRTGTTAEEQHEGESLAERLSEERPDPALRVPDPVTEDEDDGVGDTARADAVVLATGYRERPLDQLLAGLDPYIRKDSAARPRVDEHFRLGLDPSITGS
ncbi:hypothetical protein, partial [Streptomyces flavofungini]|uniref:hypothetical protein n=1 Tax=Streptomyces flavofungini TaxID=68200 RepID=UPI0034DE5D9C